MHENLVLNSAWGFRKGKQVEIIFLPEKNNV